MARIDYFPEVKVYVRDKFCDHRGELYTIWKNDESEFLNFNHDKIAKSHKDVLRGLHTDKSWKLITCLYGKIQLVIYNKIENNWTDFILDSDNKKIVSVLVPPGYYNGHLVLSDIAIFHYKWAYDGDYPDVDQQQSIYYLDPKANIDWQCEFPILSERDKKI